MARPTTGTNPPPRTPSSPTTTTTDTKRLPDDPQQQRPGTSGTEAALKITRRRASEKYRQAERAERAYRAKKRSAATRANYGDAKDHFRQAREHFGVGVKLLVAVVKGWPYVLREKREARRLKGEEEKRRKVVEMKRRLDEKLGSEGGEGEGEEVKVV
ncbi:hypothetical protein C8A01DRAFT_44186 [Parachaetomium inaequale]|uniref:Uncharacterized protein n=1 Tax=Parachaetomium inaequale TaxID=2588326 RepID=A0AAN6PKU1_9PEZI|nr:hypothetical protein C8A01DRAFT_44186 [Parachaetomium inaequale]